MSVLLLFLFVVQTVPAMPTSLQITLEKPMSQRIIEIRKDPKHAYPKLIETAFDSKQQLRLRWRALTTMGKVDALYFQKELERALKSREWFIRNAALIAILNADRSTAVKWSTEMLKDSSLMVRTQAVRNLVGLEAKESEPALWRELWNRQNFRKKESLWIRAHVAEALARIADAGHRKEFERLLLDPDPRLHRWAVLGLEKATGLKLSSSNEAIEVQRQKWLARLGIESI
jgi:HEAT repeat protein